MAQETPGECLMSEKILVLGVGNILLKDDGIGPHVIAALDRKTAWPNVVG